MIFPLYSHQPRDAVAVHVAVALVDEAGVGALAATVAAAADLACVEKTGFKIKAVRFRFKFKMYPPRDTATNRTKIAAADLAAMVFPSKLAGYCSVEC